MPIEAIGYIIFIHAILSIILKGICLLIATRIVFLPEIYTGHKILIFLFILTKHQLVIIMHMSGPRDMQSINPASQQCAWLNFLYSFRNLISTLYIRSLQQAFTITRINKTMAVHP